jgi:hypothetical protein
VWRENGDAEGGLDVGAAFDVLRRCPNLVYCEIRVTRASEKPFTLDTSSIILPHLCTLVLSGFHFEFQSWISQLVLPNLRSLRLGDVALEEIASSATRDGSMCADIDTNRFTSSSLHELLESFPTISQLRLSSIHFQELLPDDAFMVLLHNLCPMLTNITILEPPSAGFSDAAALAFVEARMALPTPLQHFRVRFSHPRPRDVDVMLELQPFISEGLRVSIEYLPGSRWDFRSRDGLGVLRSWY